MPRKWENANSPELVKAVAYIKKRFGETQYDICPPNKDRKQHPLTFIAHDKKVVSRFMVVRVTRSSKILVYPYVALVDYDRMNVLLKELQKRISPIPILRSRRALHLQPGLNGWRGWFGEKTLEDIATARQKELETKKEEQAA